MATSRARSKTPDDKDKKALWVQWTRDAMSKYVLPEKVEDADELVDDMAEVMTKYADQMLDEYEERFESRRGDDRWRQRDDEPDEPEDPEEPEEPEDD